MDFTGLRWKSTIDAFLNRHVVKLPSKYLYLCLFSYPWPKKLLLAVGYG